MKRWLLYALPFVLAGLADDPPHPTDAQVATVDSMSFGVSGFRPSGSQFHSALIDPPGSDLVFVELVIANHGISPRRVGTLMITDDRGRQFKPTRIYWKLGDHSSWRYTDLLRQLDEFDSINPGVAASGYLAYAIVFDRRRAYYLIIPGKDPLDPNEGLAKRICLYRPEDPSKWTVLQLREADADAKGVRTTVRSASWRVHDGVETLEVSVTIENGSQEKLPAPRMRLAYMQSGAVESAEGVTAPAKPVGPNGKRSYRLIYTFKRAKAAWNDIPFYVRIRDGIYVRLNPSDD